MCLSLRNTGRLESARSGPVEWRREDARTNSRALRSHIPQVSDGRQKADHNQPETRFRRIRLVGDQE